MGRRTFLFAMFGLFVCALPTRPRRARDGDDEWVIVDGWIARRSQLSRLAHRTPG